jgi:hypothetical protein
MKGSFREESVCILALFQLYGTSYFQTAAKYTKLKSPTNPAKGKLPNPGFSIDEIPAENIDLRVSRCNNPTKADLKLHLSILKTPVSQTKSKR